MDISKKTLVNIIPKIKVNHVFSPEALGKNTPITKEPNIIFAASERKLEIILICSGYNIYRNNIIIK